MAILIYLVFLKSIAHTCSGKYVPLSDATLLSRIIIGGCREELNLFKLTNKVIELYNKEVDEGRDSLSKACKKISKILKDDGVTIPILVFDDFSQDAMFSYKHAFDNAETLEEARRSLTIRSGSLGSSTNKARQKADIVMLAPTEDHIMRILTRHNNTLTKEKNKKDKKIKEDIEIDLKVKEKLDKEEKEVTKKIPNDSNSSEEKFKPKVDLDVLDVEKWEIELNGCGLTTEKTKNIAKKFTENELNLRDVADFDHDLLISMGITVAKERMALLKWSKTKI